MQMLTRAAARIGLSRLDAGRPFFAQLLVFILLGWYPQLQSVYSSAERGTSLGLSLAIAGVVAGFAWGSGRAADVVVAAASGAAGCAAGIALGAALTAELAAVRDFYASALEPAALSSALWTELAWPVVGSGLGVLAGGISATLLGGPVRPRLTFPTFGLIVGAVLVALAFAAVAASIDLVVSAVAGGSSPLLGTPAIRAAVMLACCVAAASAAFGCRPSDAGPVIRVGVPRLIVAVILAVVPFAVAEVYRSFVLNPF